MPSLKLKLPGLRSRSFFTLMFIPHTDKPVARMRLSARWIKALLVLFAAVLFTLAGFGIKYIHMRNNMAELKSLRTVNKEQQKKLKSLESEARDLQSEMVQLKYLERDVRDMLEEGDLADRSGENISYRTSLTARGGGPASRDINRQSEPTFLFGGQPSFRERTEDWEKRYSASRNIISSLSGQVDDVREELNLLKKDVAARQRYLAARPSGWPVRGRITSGYGARQSPLSGGDDFHPALDIAASYGAPVVATGKGRVIFTGYKPGYGLTVIISHPFGFKTFYAHNSSYLVDVGDTVVRGEQIARVGSSGNSTGPHVHYQVFVNGVTVDPSDFLR